MALFDEVIIIIEELEELSQEEIEKLEDETWGDV